MASFSVPVYRVFNQGQALAGATVYVYQTGTTTQVGTYADPALTTPNPWPLVADSNGEISFYVPLTPVLRLDICTSGGALIRSVDPVYPVPDLSDYNTANTGRTKVTVPVTYYVNGSTGSDLNDGLTASTAWRTIQKAVGFVCDSLILNNAQVTIQLANGAYAENVTLRNYVGSASANTTNPVIQGDILNNANVTVAPATGDAFTMVNCNTPWVVSGLKPACASGNGFVADFDSTLYLKNVNFGACSGNHMVAEWGSRIEMLTGTYTISGAAAAHAFAVRGGQVLAQSNTATITGTAAFTAFASATDKASVIDLSGCTWSGSATGAQSSVYFGGTVIHPSALPGNASQVNNDYAESVVLIGGQVALTTATVANIASLSLPEGEWDVWAEACFNGGGTTTVTYLTASISNANNTLSTVPGNFCTSSEYGGTTFGSGLPVALTAGPTRVPLAATTTLYMNVKAAFGTSTCFAYGTLRARRVGDY